MFVFAHLFPHLFPDISIKSTKKKLHFQSWIKFLQRFRSFFLEGEFRAQYKLGSNERAWKIQKNEPSLTFMCQLVLEISQFKVIFPPHKDGAIFMILSLVPMKKKSSMTSQLHYQKLWEKKKV